MEFIEVLKILMAEKNLRQADICRMTNIPTSLMSDYVKGKKSPAIMNAMSIADALGVSLDQLVGRIPINPHPHHPSESVIIKNNLELDHIKKYRALDERGQQTVDTVLNNLYEIAAVQKETTSLIPSQDEPAGTINSMTREEAIQAVNEQFDAIQKGTTSVISSFTKSSADTKIG